MQPVIGKKALNLLSQGSSQSAPWHWLSSSMGLTLALGLVVLE
jgi:hypothetical protein